MFPLEFYTLWILFYFLLWICKVLFKNVFLFFFKDTNFLSFFWCQTGQIIHLSGGNASYCHIRTKCFLVNCNWVEGVLCIVDHPFLSGSFMQNTYSIHLQLQLNDIWLHHTLLGILLHQLDTQCALAEFHHGLPEWWIQEDLAHHMALQSGSVTLQVAQELLSGQVQVFTKHVNVQVVPKWRN